MIRASYLQHYKRSDFLSCTLILNLSVGTAHDAVTARVLAFARQCKMAEALLSEGYDFTKRANASLDRLTGKPFSAKCLQFKSNRFTKILTRLQFSQKEFRVFQKGFQIIGNGFQVFPNGFRITAKELEFFLNGLHFAAIGLHRQTFLLRFTAFVFRFSAFGFHPAFSVLQLYSCWWDVANRNRLYAEGLSPAPGLKQEWPVRNRDSPACAASLSGRPYEPLLF